MSAALAVFMSIHGAFRDTCLARTNKILHLLINFDLILKENDTSEAPAPFSVISLSAPYFLFAVVGCRCGSVRSARGARLNKAIRKEKKKREPCVWISPFTRLAGHQLVFLSECKDGSG